MSIPIVLGTARSTGNGTGLAQILIERCKLQGIEARLASELLPSGISLPTGPITEDVMPALVTDPSDYQDETVQGWSRLVSSSKALIILTPQYNWGIPGPLKNALDHLYHEWRGKPILVVTYGGHGGTKCAEQLTSVLQGGLKAALITDPVCITLPSPFIRSSERVHPDDANQQDFRDTFVPSLDTAINKIKSVVVR